jgi:hypothetical protein
MDFVRRFLLAEYKWYDPPVVQAPCHTDKSATVKYAASDDLIGRRGPNFLYTPIYMYWTHLCGTLPPINAIGKLAVGETVPTLTTLFDSTGCFQGIKRPHLKEDNGDNVVTYVLKPEVTIEYASAMACMARALKPTVPFVLTVQAVLANSLQDCSNGISGLITRIEPVYCDSENDNLPVDFQTRYRKQCW